MSSSPPIKVFRDGKYVAACHFFEDAAAIAAMTPGTKVRWHHDGPVIWVEGLEEIPAGESYDRAAQIMELRVPIAQRRRGK